MHIVQTHESFHYKRQRRQQEYKSMGDSTTKDPSPLQLYLTGFLNMSLSKKERRHANAW